MIQLARLLLLTFTKGLRIQQQTTDRRHAGMLGCLLHTPPLPHLLIRSWRSGVLDQTPALLLPCPVQTSTLSALSDSQTAEVWDPLPDRPISSQRNPTNEALWGTDAERPAWAKTTCHSHLMITHTRLCHRGFQDAVFVYM